MSAWQLVVWASAVVAALVLVWRKAPKLWAAVKRAHARFGAAIRLAETLSTLSTDLDEIKSVLGTVRHEIQPNGGGSLKDASTRTEAKVDELVAQLAETRGDLAHVRRQAASLKTSVSRVNRRLTDHIEAGERPAVTAPVGVQEGT